MKEISKQLLQDITLQVLHMELKNLRSKARSDQKMSEELQKVIVEYVRRNH